MAKAALRRTSELAQSIRGAPPKRAPRPQTRGLEAAYIARVRTLLTEFLEVVEEELDPVIEQIAAPQPPRFDAPSDVIERSFAGLRVRFARIFEPPKVRRIARESASQINSHNRDLFRRTMRTVAGVDPIMSEPWLMEAVEGFVRENVSLIRSIPEKWLGEVEQMLYRDAQRRLSPNEIKAKLRARFKVSEARAELIATDQVLKFNGSLTELRQQSIGVKKYVWRTAGDQRVRGNPAGRYPDARPSHYALDGKVFSWDKPPVSGTNGERLHPGQPIRCRCYAEPVLDDTKSRGR